MFDARSRLLLLKMMEAVMTDEAKAVFVRISGRVQGVGFRFWMQGQAQRLGLSGWVCNEADGSVAALVCGPAAAVSAMLERCRIGPSGASVADVETQSTLLDGVPPGFRIMK
jgi:acylphosphatase